MKEFKFKANKDFFEATGEDYSDVNFDLIYTAQLIGDEYVVSWQGETNIDFVTYTIEEAEQCLGDTSWVLV